MNCEICGREIDKDCQVCPYCGKQQSANFQKSKHIIDSGSIFFTILSFFFPILGIILYFAWRKTKPKSAIYIVISTLLSLVTIIYLIFS